MALLNIDPLKYLENLPYFDGSPQDLSTFCGLVDRIGPILVEYDVNVQPMFIDIIKGKLRGRAKLIIDINCDVDAWDEMKDILINNFSEKKSCAELFYELRNSVFKTNCVDFFNEIMRKLQRLNTKAKLTRDVVGNLNDYIGNNKTSALKIFVNGLPEPMRSVLICRNPETLENAIDILFTSGYAYHGKNSGRNNQNNGNFQKNRPRNKHTENFNGNRDKYRDFGSNNNNRNNRYGGVNKIIILPRIGIIAIISMAIG